MVLQELILEREIQQKYSKWDDLHQQKDLSKVIFSSDSKCVRAHPESSFITVFTPSGHSKGIHYWEVKVTKGRVIYSYMIGVGEKNNIRSGLHSHGFCYRSEGNKSPPAHGIEYGESYGTGDVIGIVLNADDGEMEFFKNGKSQGIAFNDVRLKDNIIYPGVSLNNDGDAVQLLIYIPYERSKASKEPWCNSEIIKKKLAKDASKEAYFKYTK
eukprot:TRINITY_DN982_c0_g1_i5.p1 TRINITY_DN982_c0_g1~~TRINITY_DN982_c0_g1_i5.p1  ORF type:complete len:213 (-),score=34.74 TRINITY_DN982_c0_g1_i5:78-716(-)